MLARLTDTRHRQLGIDPAQAEAFSHNADTLAALTPAELAAPVPAVVVATTYALGHLAKRYYAGGRVMSTQVLKDTYQGLLPSAKQLQIQYLPQIQQKAQTLDAGQVMAMARGK